MRRPGALLILTGRSIGSPELANHAISSGCMDCWETFNKKSGKAQGGVGCSALMIGRYE